MRGVRAAVTLVLISVSLTAGCSSGGGGGTAASCASTIEVNGVTYVAGRGVLPFPTTGAELHGRTVTCDDGGSPVTSEPASAHAIPGVKTADAVATAYAVLLAERLWQVPRAELPPELQPYVRP